MKLISKEMLMSAVVTSAIIIASLAIYDRFIRERVVSPMRTPNGGDLAPDVVEVVEEEE